MSIIAKLKLPPSAATSENDGGSDDDGSGSDDDNVDGVLGQMFYWRVNKSGLTSVDYVAKYEMIVTAR